MKHYVTFNEKYHNESTASERSVMNTQGRACICVCVGGGGWGSGRGGWGSLSKLYGIPTLALIFHSGKNVKYIYLFGPFGGLVTHPLIITGNKQITDKAYNEAQLIIFWVGKLLCFDSQVHW